jgi:hypothetical protein
VYIQYRRVDDVLAVPTEAILDSGKRKIVFVEVRDGRFEPREVVTGLTGDHHMTEIVSGIDEGDQIVASGQFLLDSESQLQEGIRKMLAGRSGRAESAAAAEPQTLYACPMHPEQVSDRPGRCPECGMDLEEREAKPGELARLHEGHRHDREGETSRAAEGAKYFCPMHPEITSEEPGRCPVCGMFLESKSEEPETEP